MAWLNLYTSAPEATSIYTAVRGHAMAVNSAGDPRTLTQLTADVFTDAISAALCGELPTADGADPASTDESGGRPVNPGSVSGGAAAPGADARSRSGFGFGSSAAFRRIRPTVTVTVPALTLLGITDEPATLEGYGPIDAETARALAGQSKTWYRMLTDPKTGTPITLDSTRYRPTKAMKRFLRYRDGTCRFPGCNRAATHCDLDHTKDYQHGGLTECENLSHLCRKHHRLKHQTTWKVKQAGNGVLEWTSPGGRRYTTHPDVLLTDPGPPPKKPDPKPREPDPKPPTDLNDTPPF
jgi:hypothetical protein